MSSVIEKLKNIKKEIKKIHNANTGSYLEPDLNIPTIKNNLRLSENFKF